MLRSLREKYSKIPLAAKASFWFVFCSVLQKGIALITTPFFARLMSNEQYGQFTMYNSWVEIFMVFATLNVFYGVYNNALTKYQEDRDRVTSSMLGFCTTLTTIVCLIYVCLHEFFNTLTRMSTTMTLLLFVEILFIPGFYFWSAKERFEYKYKKLILATLTMAILSPLMGIPAVILSSEKGYARIVTAVLSQVLISAVLYVAIFRKGKKYFDRGYWKYALTFNLPLIPHYLSSMLLNHSDRVMIDRMCGTDKAGIYGLAYTLGTMIIMINTAVMNSFTPYTYQNLKNKNYSAIKKTASYLVFLISGISLLVLLVAPEIMFLIGGEKYSDGVWIIAPIAASVFFRFLYSLYANIEFYYEENYFIMVASIICALLNVITNYIFIRLFGYLAAGFTTLGCFAIYAFAHFIFSQRVLKKHISQCGLYDNKTILLISLFLIVLSLLVMFLYPYPIIRYGIVLITTIFVLLFRKKIITALLTIRGKE